MGFSVMKAHPKRATNISLSVDVYKEAKLLGIHLSQTCEHFRQKLRARSIVCLALSERARAAC